MDGKVQPSQPQVFINFRGDELRNNFISHLTDALQRNGIKFFIDKHEKMGEDIKNLLKRIEDSEIALAVFSKRYTESYWCLDELAKISQCADLGKLKVLPIFYKVSTESVKGLLGEFGEHFKRHESDKKVEQPRIDQWKKALTSVSNKIGLVFDDKSLAESEFIANIVNAVLEMLQDITAKSLVKKLPEREETSSLKKNSKKSLKPQKGSLVSPPKAEIISFPGSNSLAHQSIASGRGPIPVQGSHITIQFAQAASPANAVKHGVTPVQQPYNMVVQPSHASGFTGTRPPFNGFPIRYDNHEIRARGENSSKANNTKKPNKSSKSNLDFNGWVS